ncbi:MAG TPA: hypothetical protein VLC98_09520 [Phnomibacter sp.]|nr:hypothetical protein [Phnomibacter sp.]
MATEELKHVSGQHASDTKADYWQSRPVLKKISFAEKIRSNQLISVLLSFILPMRFGNEKRVASWLKKLQPNTVLDVACGVGKIQIPKFSEYSIGVDITGYPKMSAQLKGYHELLTYAPPSYEFNTSRQADTITIINLNAHISKDSFGKILTMALSNSKDHSYVILINEYKGSNLVYSLMNHFSKNKFAAMIAMQQHDYFTTHHEFSSWLSSNFSNLHTIQSKSVATLPPLLHTFSYLKSGNGKNYFEIGVPAWLNIFFLLIEIPLGILDSLYMRLFPSRTIDKSYICGHLFKVEKK